MFMSSSDAILTVATSDLFKKNILMHFILSSKHSTILEFTVSDRKENILSNPICLKDVT